MAYQDPFDPDEYLARIRQGVGGDTAAFDPDAYLTNIRREAPTLDTALTRRAAPILPERTTAPVPEYLQQPIATEPIEDRSFPGLEPGGRGGIRDFFRNLVVPSARPGGLPEPPPIEEAGRVRKSIYTGLTNVAKTVGQEVRGLGRGLKADVEKMRQVQAEHPEAPLQFPEGPGRLPEFLEQTGTEIAGRAQEFQETIPVDKPENLAQWLATTIPAAMISTLPSMVAAGVVTATGGGIGAAGLAAAIPGYFLNKNEARETLRESGPGYEGMNEDEAEAAASLIAIPMAALDAFMPARIAGKWAGGVRELLQKGITRRVLAEYARNTGIEAITEGLQSGVGQVAALAETGRPINWQQIAEEFAAGGIVGGLIGAGSQIAIEGSRGTDRPVTIPLGPPSPRLETEREAAIRPGMEPPVTPSGAVPFPEPPPVVERAPEAAGPAIPEPVGTVLSEEEARARQAAVRDPVTGEISTDPMDRPTFERRAAEQLGPPEGIAERRAEVAEPTPAPTGLGPAFEPTAEQPTVAEVGVRRQYVTHEELRTAPLQDLETMVEEVLDADANLLTDLFGQEGAKRYKRLQAKANSMMAPMEEVNKAYDEASMMEEALSKADQDRLFGMNFPKDSESDPLDLRRLRQDINYYKPDNISDEPDNLLRNTIARELTEGNLTENPSSIVRFRGALDELKRRGFTEEDVVKSVVERAENIGMAPGDLLDLFHAQLKNLGITAPSTAPTQPSIQPTEPAQLPPAVAPEVTGAGPVEVPITERYAQAQEGEPVGGLTVRSDVPNVESISATFNEGEYDVLPGIRRLPMSEWGEYEPHYNVATNEHRRALAEEIRQSGEIAPLIIVDDPVDGPYILEGENRFDALQMNGVEEFPAMVVVPHGTSEAALPPEQPTPAAAPEVVPEVGPAEVAPEVTPTELQTVQSPVPLKTMAAKQLAEMRDRLNEDMTAADRRRPGYAPNLSDEQRALANASADEEVAAIEADLALLKERAMEAAPVLAAQANGEWYPILRAKPVKIAGLEDFDTFIHRAKEVPGFTGTGATTWVITEGQTGQRLGIGRTQKDAKANILDRIEHMGVEEVREIIRERVKVSRSPKYPDPEPLPANVPAVDQSFGPDPLPVAPPPVPGALPPTGPPAEPVTAKRPRREKAEVLPAVEPAPEQSSAVLDDLTSKGDAVRVGGKETGAVDTQTVTTGVRDFLRRNFTAPGNLPKMVFNRMIKRDGGVNSKNRQIAYTIRDFRRKAREVYGTTNLNDEQLKQINSALQGELTGMPEEMWGVVNEMRGQVDVLSQLLIDSGAIAESLIPTVSENRGFYLTRSYKAFDDPNFWKTVPNDVQNKVRSLLASELPQLSAEELEGEFQRILRAGELADSPLDYLSRGSKLGSKNLSILQRRKDIAPEIRAMWGEYTDPKVNYVRSVTKMSHLLENHKFLSDVMAEGAGQFFFDKPTVRDDVSYVKEFASEGSRALEPLNGLYTTPEIEAAFRQAVESAPVSDWLRVYMKVNSAVKFAKTIGSVMTHVRNTTGNTGFAVANGHWDIRKMGDAARGVWGDVWDVGLKDKTKWRETYRELVELGVVHESARAGELWDAIKDATQDPETLTGSLPQKTARKALRGATALYRAEDDVWKIYAFANEYERYRAALPESEWSDQQVKEHAAEIVRNTYPTYSLVPEAIKKVRRFPLVGTFVSFPWEVFRTLSHSLELTHSELNNPNPKVKKIGAQRLAGLATAASVVPAVAAASRFLNGIDDETDERIRRFMPPWSKNSNLVYLGRNDEGKVQLVDLSYTDPYSYLRTPLKAMMRGENWHSGLVNAFIEASAPFLSEEILASKLIDVARNQKKDSGSLVYNPEAPADEIGADIFKHVFDALEPGTVSSMERIWRGLSNKQTMYGRSYNPTVEALAVMTGFRAQELDVPQALSWNARDALDRWGQATRLLSSVASRGGDVTEAEIQEAYNTSDRARREVFDNMSQDIAAARSLGMDDDAIKDVLRGSGISAKMTQELLSGSYMPYQPSAQFLERMSSARQSTAKVEDRPGVRNVYDERRRLVQRLAADALAEARRASGLPPTQGGTRTRSRRPARPTRR